MARRLVVCCDGTWNQAQARTHVWRLRGAVAVGPRPIGNAQRGAAKPPSDKMVRVEASHEAAFDCIGGDAAAKLPGRPDQRPYRPKNIANDAGEVRADVEGVPRFREPPA